VRIKKVIVKVFLREEVCSLTNTLFEVMDSSPENNLLQKCRERLYIRFKMVRPYTSGSCVHQAALFCVLLNKFNSHVYFS
jgi:hypothetical protein